MTPRKIRKSLLDKWHRDYRKTLKDAKETRSCMIRLQDLERLVAYMKLHKEVDGIKIYLVRQNKNIEPTYRWGLQPLKDGVTAQIGFAIVPTYDYQDNSPNNRQSGAKTYVEQNGEVMCLMPGGEHSGMCPSNCR